MVRGMDRRFLHVSGAESTENADAYSYMLKARSCVFRHEREWNSVTRQHARIGQRGPKRAKRFLQLIIDLLLQRIT